MTYIHSLILKLYVVSTQLTVWLTDYYYCVSVNSLQIKGVLDEHKAPSFPTNLSFGAGMQQEPTDCCKNPTPPPLVVGSSGDHSLASPG